MNCGIRCVRILMRKKLCEMLFGRIRKRFGWYNLQKEGSKWVKEHLGEEYVQEFNDNYEKINSGVPMGNIFETIAFLDMIDTIKDEI